MIEYILKSKTLLTKDELNQLDNLHYSDGFCWRFLKRHDKLGIVILAINKKSIIGWGLVFERDDEKTLFIYISKKWRRNGIGREIYAQAVYNFGNHIAVSRHSTVAQKFYDSMGA